MKKFYSLIGIIFFFAANVFAQNVGINNTDPKAALDINGGFRLRSENATVSGTSVMLNSNRSHHVLIGSPTGDFNIAFIGATDDGQHAIITNITLFKGFLVPVYIQPNTTVELIYSNGAWKQIGSSEAISTTAWSRTGNSGTIDGVNNLFGTTDNKPIRIIQNNFPSGLLDAERNNYFFGGSAGANVHATAIGNSGFGGNALSSLTTGWFNTAIGNQSLASNKSGFNNVAIGYDAMSADTGSSYNVAVGSKALGLNVNRTGNTAIGTQALYTNASPGLSPILADEGLNNTALGFNTLFRNRRGSGSVAIGFHAAYSDTAADGIVAIGRAALFNNKYQGLNEVTGNIYGGLVGINNLAIGDSALFNNGTGAVSTTATASNNIAIGKRSLFFNTTGSFNNASGLWALIRNTTGSYNVASGSLAGYDNQTGDGNTSIGSFAALKSEGSLNTAIGYNALQAYRIGDRNTALGSSALSANGSTSFNGSGNVAIGYRAGYDQAVSDKLFIENSGANKDNALIYGDFAADSLLLNAKTINKFSLNVRGNNALEMGYGTPSKQTDAGKLCYGCFGDPAHWLSIVGGGTVAGAGNDRVIKLWTEGGLRIRGNSNPDADNFYTLGTSAQRWAAVWAVNGAIQTSDANLKTNIATSPYGLQQVLQMKPVQYNWKTNPNADLQIGFLAQDIQKIIPEAVVSPTNGDPMGMKYTELIPVLVKAIQDQQKQIDDLKKENEAIKNKLGMEK